MAPPNPPRPPGLAPLKRATSEMGQWAVSIVGDSSTYPMHSETVRLFGDKLIAARVEWHSWSTRGQHGMGGDPNAKIPGTFRGATLYQIADPDAYGTYLYNKNQSVAVSGGTMSRRFYAGAAAPPKHNPKTVTEHAQGLITLAAKPVKWTAHTAGSLVQWAGSQLQNLGNKL